MRYDKLEIISNNPSIADLNTSVKFTQLNSINDVLMLTRDKIHLGGKLISHPLAGSVKPHETPYRSIIVLNNHDELDMDALNLIEQAIERYQVLCKANPTHLTLTDEDIDARFPEKQKTDFRFIDLQLIKSCLDSLGFKGLS
ncbi:GrdX family protein [Photobacterium sp. SDRW27]|uniref:GrdX family protein n=1 Tax=Photobacterium obscurum TaxID=2829490 RepID=UPI0022432FC4|nr:GrdX family protein [Photobacterium obscurum]MCW8328677.1 GrdX family protein [Photobacterium obscurum]